MMVAASCHKRGAFGMRPQQRIGVAFITLLGLMGAAASEPTTPVAGGIDVRFQADNVSAQQLDLMGSGATLPGGAVLENVQSDQFAADAVPIIVLPSTPTAPAGATTTTTTSSPEPSSIPWPGTSSSGMYEGSANRSTRAMSLSTASSISFIRILASSSSVSVWSNMSSSSSTITGGSLPSTPSLSTQSRISTTSSAPLMMSSSQSSSRSPTTTASPRRPTTSTPTKKTSTKLVMATTLPPLPPCDPGWLRNAFTEECSIPCPAGAWCVRSDAIPCPTGTASPAVGMQSNDTCAQCLPGTYAPTAASAVCLACPIGAYCPAMATTTPTQCPDHTVSGAGSVDLSQCDCLPNYLCTYTRRIQLRLAFDTAANNNMTLADLQADTVMANFIRDSVVQAMGLIGLPGVTATFDGFLSR